jgi:hypothetical protein
MRERHLARTEAVDADTALHVLKTLVHLSFHVLGRDDDLDFALQPFSERFDNLHVQTFISSWRCSNRPAGYGEHPAGPFAGSGFTEFGGLLASKMALYNAHCTRKPLVSTFGGSGAGRET